MTDDLDPEPTRSFSQQLPPTVSESRSWRYGGRLEGTPGEPEQDRRPEDAAGGGRRRLDDADVGV